MHYGAIKKYDIANGPGCRLSIFVSGCRNRCPGCFNEETWSFTYGEKLTVEDFQRILEDLGDSNISGLSILGGDPFEPENQGKILLLCKHAKELFPEKTIWIWSGYLFEDLKNLPVMKFVDVLVDGPFEEVKRNLALKYRGSWNQRVIDVQKSLQHGCTIRWDYEEDPEVYNTR